MRIMAHINAFDDSILSTYNAAIFCANECSYLYSVFSPIFSSYMGTYIVSDKSAFSNTFRISIISTEYTAFEYPI